MVERRSLGDLAGCANVTGEEALGEEW